LLFSVTGAFDIFIGQPSFWEAQELNMAVITAIKHITPAILILDLIVITFVFE
jgi:hypothetical protein